MVKKKTQNSNAFIKTHMNNTFFEKNFFNTMVI